MSALSCAPLPPTRRLSPKHLHIHTRCIRFLLVFIFRRQDRSIIAIYQSIGWSIGTSLMPLLFWWLRDWVVFMWLTTIPTAIVLIFFKYVYPHTHTYTKYYTGMMSATTKMFTICAEIHIELKKEHTKSH